MYILPFFKGLSDDERRWDSSISRSKLRGLLYADCRGALLSSPHNPRLLKCFTEGEESPVNILTSFPVFSKTDRAMKGPRGKEDLEICFNWPFIFSHFTQQTRMKVMPSLAYLIRMLMPLITRKYSILGDLIPRYFGSVYSFGVPVYGEYTPRDASLLDYYMRELSFDNEFIETLMSVFSGVFGAASHSYPDRALLRIRKHTAITYESVYKQTSILNLDRPMTDGTSDVHVPMAKYPRPPRRDDVLTWLTAITELVPSNYMEWYSSSGMQYSAGGSNNPDDALKVVNKDGAEIGVVKSGGGSMIFINLRRLPLEYLLSPFVTESKYFKTLKFDVDSIVTANIPGVPHPVLSLPDVEKLRNLLLKKYASIFMAHSEPKVAKLLSIVEERYGWLDADLSDIFVVDANTLATHLQRLFSSLYTPAGVAKRLDTTKARRVARPTGGYPTKFITVTYPNPIIKSDDGFRVQDGAGVPLEIRVFFSRGETYYHLGKIPQNIDDFREPTTSSRRSERASKGESRHYRFKDGILSHPDPKFAGGLFTYRALHNILKVRDGVYQTRWGIENRQEFINWLDQWRFSSHDHFMSYRRRIEQNEKLAKPKAKGAPMWSDEEDAYIIKYYRPDMDDDVRDFLFGSICKHRSKDTVYKRVTTLRRKLVKEGVYNLDDLPHAQYNHRIGLEIERAKKARGET